MTRAVLERIAVAAGAADPVAALASLADLPAVDRWAQEFGWSSRRIRRNAALIAGLYLRAGRIDEALSVLSNVSIVEPIGEAEAIVLDPGLVRVSGHYHTADLFYLRAAERAGLRTRVVRAALPDPTFAGDATSSVPALVVTQRLPMFPLTAQAADRTAFDCLFELDFRRALPTIRPRLMIVPTAAEEFIRALARYLLSTPGDGPSSVLLANVNNHLGGPDCPKHIARAYRAAFADLAAAGIRLAVVVETEAIGSGVARLLSPSQEVILSPFVGTYMDELGVAASGNTEPVIGFVGQTRQNRGADLVPGIARATMAERAGGFRWRVQYDLDRLQPGDDFAELVADGRLELVPPHLSSPDYFDLVRSIDIMLMPYADAYTMAPSGIGAECLRVGSVQIVPEGSTMAREAERRGAGYVTYRGQTVEAVTSAVLEAIDRFPELRARSARAAANLTDDPAYRRIMEFVGSA